MRVQWGEMWVQWGEMRVTVGWDECCCVHEITYVVMWWSIVNALATVCMCAVCNPMHPTEHSRQYYSVSVNVTYSPVGSCRTRLYLLWPFWLCWWSLRSSFSLLSRSNKQRKTNSHKPIPAWLTLVLVCCCSIIMQSHHRFHHNYVYNNYVYMNVHTSYIV